MVAAPTVLVIGDGELVGPYVQAFSANWPTAAGWSGSEPLARAPQPSDVVVVELSSQSCSLRLADESVRLSGPPPPADLTALVGLIIRISEFDRQLQLAEDMETMGVVARSIAHDANNLLAVVLGSLRELRKGAEQPFLIQTGEQAALRIAGLLKRLLSFRRDNAARSVNISAVVVDLLPILRSFVGPNIGIRERLAAVPPVGWDVLAVERVLINLVANSRAALPLGGHIDVTTRVEGREPSQHGPPFVEASSHSVLLEVKDNGTGMLPETLARAFEPLFTTKAPGHGSGLGLKSVRRLVVRAGGTIQLDSQPGRGTNVTIRLPSAR